MLGAVMSKFTKQNAIAAGAQIAFLAGMAIAAGYLIGRFVDLFIQR